MATTKRSPADRVRALLTKKKHLTEKEVLAQVNGTDRKQIRAIRVSLGIDRQSAISDARGRLMKEPSLPANRLIDEIMATYGVRLGAPDVSRLRPKKVKQRPKKLKTPKTHDDLNVSYYGMSMPTAEQEAAASNVGIFLGKVAEGVAGRKGRKAKEVRRAIDLIATDMRGNRVEPNTTVGGIVFPTVESAMTARYGVMSSRVERLEARVKKLEGGRR